MQLEVCIYIYIHIHMYMHIHICVYKSHFMYLPNLKCVICEFTILHCLLHSMCYLLYTTYDTFSALQFKFCTATLHISHLTYFHISHHALCSPYVLCLKISCMWKYIMCGVRFWALLGLGFRVEGSEFVCTFKYPCLHSCMHVCTCVRAHARMLVPDATQSYACEAMLSSSRLNPLPRLLSHKTPSCSNF